VSPLVATYLEMSTAVPQSRKYDASNLEVLELTERDWKFNRNAANVVAAKQK
jgi:hypothetical protein